MRVCGRWAFHNKRSYFVAGTPPDNVFIPPPKLVLFSWHEFLQHGKDVKLCL
jgi:hypothetical protein